MNAHAPLAVSALTLVFAAAGLAFGWSYFTVLRRGVAAYSEGGALSRCVGGLLVRLAGAALFFALAARGGAWPLLAAFIGFLGARRIAVRAARRGT